MYECWPCIYADSCASSKWRRSCLVLCQDPIGACSFSLHMELHTQTLYFCISHSKDAFCRLADDALQEACNALKGMISAAPSSWTGML